MDGTGAGADRGGGVAEQRQHPEVATLKSNYFKWLTQTGQEEKAAELQKLKDGLDVIHDDEAQGDDSQI